MSSYLRRLGNLRIDRDVTSYSAVQGVISSVRRGRRWQLRSKRVRDIRLLNVGCGDDIHPHCINLDYYWKPGIDVCWDLRQGLPFPDNSLTGLFCEHCLEHFSLDDCRQLLLEFRRILRPSATIRVSIPDAELYLRLYADTRQGHGVDFPYEEETPAMGTSPTPMMHVNRVFREYGHEYAYDFETLARLLDAAGFTEIERRDYRTGRNPRLLLDRADRSVESLYVEAIA